MSSVPMVRTPGIPPVPRARRVSRRAGVVLMTIAGLAVVTAYLLAAWVPAPAPASPRSGSAAALAAAHARAVELAKAHSAATPLATSVEPRRRSSRVADAAWATELFRTHSWYVPPPPPPPAPPAPEPPPSAPPFPYTFVGSFSPEGDLPVYFLARGDRVIDTRVGDHLDGVYAFESATAGQLIFTYLPLNIRQIVAIGVPQ